LDKLLTFQLVQI
jgi:hypothetical protein